MLKINQAMAHTVDTQRSEVKIMMASFITAFSIALIVVTVLFMTVRKIESQLSNSTSIASSVTR
jgi:heme/copper-type cytochrome/quinol oxidase subunit 2